MTMDIQQYFQRFLANYTPYKKYWNYEDGCVLKGCIDLYHATGDVLYRDFVLDYVSAYVAADGSIPNYEMRQYNIDSINSGKALFFALEETGEERYRKAIEFHMQRLREHPRCQCGNFWHKQLYPNQIWLDGLYMAQPFYMAYEAKFDGMAHVADITRQFQNVRKYLYNPEKGLNYHAYDEARVQFWADKETGCSKNFWLRSTGWYLMALVDCIALCSEQLYEHYRALVDIFRESMRGVLAYRAEDGLFSGGRGELHRNFRFRDDCVQPAQGRAHRCVGRGEVSADCAGCVREAGGKQAAHGGGRRCPPDRYLLGGRAWPGQESAA